MQFERLGPYKIGKRLGRGGMGAVFEGVNVDTGESAAIKVLNPHLADDEGFRERFETGNRNAQETQASEHRADVRLRRTGWAICITPWNWSRAAASKKNCNMAGDSLGAKWCITSVELCKALRHAHDHGVIHRDIKPANLLLTEADDEIKLTDFGIARLFGNNRLTMEGGLVGTAEYMSPEQASGERVTPQSDLYSLGGVMFAMLAGRPPFRTPVPGRNAAQAAIRSSRRRCRGLPPMFRRSWKSSSPDCFRKIRKPGPQCPGAEPAIGGDGAWLVDRPATDRGQCDTSRRRHFRGCRPHRERSQCTVQSAVADPCRGICRRGGRVRSERRHAVGAAASGWRRTEAHRPVDWNRDYRTAPHLRSPPPAANVRWVKHRRQCED